ncbi:MAG: FeoB-associated Cys-rich membrane protein [Spirochaetaceae bacterium]|jgi:hypothetical protein|nr:FeoB-associated Cys-rich membrane protein [Spirochaetaceae bacterium]
MGTIIIGIAVFGIIGAIAARLIINARKGKTGCSCGCCGGCPPDASGAELPAGAGAEAAV